MCAFLLWGAPALAGPGGDFDGDGILDANDNCSIKSNSAQDDTDGDKCGNLCDADYVTAPGNGIVALNDFGQFSVRFGLTGHPLQQHVQPISAANPVALHDFGYFSSAFGGVPGPSGTTTGTVACP
jgi:hypothetical protein